LDGNCGVRALEGSRRTAGDSLTVGIDSPQTLGYMGVEEIVTVAEKRSVSAI
jgi:hypothetical protein